MTMRFGSVANDSLRFGSCGLRSYCASHCASRRESTSSIAAKSSGTPCSSPRIVKRLQGVERLDPLLAAALGLELLLLERELGVALGELEQPALVAALGRAHLHAGAAPLGEQLGQHV